MNASTPIGFTLQNQTSIDATTNDSNAGNDLALTSTSTKLNPLPIVVGADAGGGPHVKVFDPVTGAETRSFYAYDANFKGGVRVAAGDVNGDGTPDILTAAGTGGGPHVKVFDGVTGAEIRSFYAYDGSFNGGVFIAAGDVNDDGFADIITGADAGGGPHVKAFSGQDGSLLQSFYAYGSNFTGGVRVAAGDIDGDGRADIVTGAGPGGGPHVQAFSGLDRKLLQSFYAYDANFTGGVFVAAGDLNNDNRADIITGAGAGGGPHVKVFHGTTLAELASFYAYDATFKGGVRVAVADVGNDGQLDLVTGAGPGGSAQVNAYNGLTFSQSKSFNAFDPSFLGGVFVG